MNDLHMQRTNVKSSLPPQKLGPLEVPVLRGPKFVDSAPNQNNIVSKYDHVGYRRITAMYDVDMA